MGLEEVPGPLDQDAQAHAPIRRSSQGVSDDGSLHDQIASEGEDTALITALDDRTAQGEGGPFARVGAVSQRQRQVKFSGSNQPRVEVVQVLDVVLDTQSGPVECSYSFVANEEPPSAATRASTTRNARATGTGCRWVGSRSEERCLWRKGKRAPA
ncbi:MAG: hypothetical protein DRI90_08725 [Deltaproteobacteria bacterium]|nr:MAG: hypothetical protein DRI90_08725 [Deltaproteobacteria bacterium]